MHMRGFAGYLICLMGLIGASQQVWPQQRGAAQQGRRVQERDLLYVGVPNDLVRASSIDNGGVGILAFNVRDGYRFVRRIPAWDYPASQEPEAVRGIAASPATGMLYVSVRGRLAALNLMTDKMVWEQTYDGDCCDRVAVSPDGKTLYVPRDGGTYWYVVDAATGKLIKKLPTPESDGAHNTIWSLDGSRVFMSGQRSPNISVADPKTHTVVQTVGPFSNFVRPFTINGTNTYLFANVNDLLGFEVADLKTGKKIHRVEVNGFGWSKDRRIPHQVPSHGIAMSPDEKEIWVADGVNVYIHVFDSTVMPPKQAKSIQMPDVPGWITFGLDGKFVYSSSGDVIDATTKEIVASLKDEFGRPVRSEKIVEVLFVDGKPARAVDQIGVGLVRSSR